MSKKKFTIKGTFTSVWEEGLVATDATLDPITGALITKAVEVGNLGTLKFEKFEAKNGTYYNVCPLCHEYIMRVVMLPDKTGNGLHETNVCSDPNCDSHEDDE